MNLQCFRSLPIKTVLLPLNVAYALAWFGAPLLTRSIDWSAYSTIPLGVLGLLVLPTVIIASRAALKSVPPSIRTAALGVGASPTQAVFHHVLPLAMPAVAVLAIFSIMWRWNEFLWPLIVLNRSEVYTLQVGLNAFQGELDVQWHYILAMTVVTLIPVVVVFAFLQKFITTGIASSGMK